MKVRFSRKAAAEYQYWRRKDRKVQSRIDQLLKAIAADPFGGIGKPEPLKHELSGWWSRRINAEHRLVYRVQDGQIEVIQCRFHY